LFRRRKKKVTEVTLENWNDRKAKKKCGRSTATTFHLHL